VNRRLLLLAAFVAVILLGVYGFNSGWFAPSPRLMIYLRCNGTSSGRVSIAMEGASSATQSFDLKTACENGLVELADYRRPEMLRITLDHGNGERGEVIARYGPEIQSDRRGFYTVLKITAAPPYIANDKI
jgi:hypothetical protein